MQSAFGTSNTQLVTSKNYLQAKSPIADSEQLTPGQIKDEAILLGIRMRDGLQIELLQPHQIEVLAEYRHNGFVEINDDRVLLTPEGRLIADRIVREITI